VPSSSLELGVRLTPAAVRANQRPEDLGRLADGRVETAWGSGPAQTGVEEVIADFGAEQTFQTLVLKMAAYSFGFPRELAIDVSRDGQKWEAWSRGETSVPTVRAALRDPGTVPVTFDLGGATGRYVRLRQLGSDTVPWWIAELEVYGAR
jgi:hypothetical protein